MTERFDVVIVGGGMGGLNLAALLSTGGKQVLVLEAGGPDQLGGRAASGTVDGAAVDNGVKGLIMAGSEDEIFRRIGKTMPENVCDWTGSGRVHMNGAWRNLDEVIKGSVDEFISVYLNSVDSLSFEDIERLNDISAEQFVQERTDDQGVIDFFRYLGWLFGGTLPVPHDYSAGSMFYSVKQQVQANGELPSQSYWVKGGSGAIAGPLIEAIEENGGEIRTNTPVSRVLIDGRRARGVEVVTGGRRTSVEIPDTSIIEADVVVSAVAIWDIFNILSEDDLDPWYAERLRYQHRKTLNLITLVYGLKDRELWDHSGPAWVQEGPISGRPWCASSLALPGDDTEYQVSFWLQLGWWDTPNYFQRQEASTKAALADLCERFEGDIDELFDGLSTKAGWRHRSFGPGTIMETPGNVGDALIDVKAEGIDGLYLVGERTREAKVMGVYGSAQTALAAAERILAE